MGGGCFFVKTWTFPQRRMHYVQYEYFLFYILLIWGLRTHPTHPPPAYGPESVIQTCSSSLAVNSAILKLSPMFLLYN